MSDEAIIFDVEIDRLSPYRGGVEVLENGDMEGTTEVSNRHLLFLV